MTGGMVVKAAPMQWCKAEVDGRRLGIGGQQGIGQFEQGISAALEAGIKRGTEVLDVGEGG